MRPVRLVAALALLLAPGSARAQRQVLPEGANPVRYDITVTPDAAAERFDGTVRIEVEAARALPSLTLNALDLTVSRATVDGRVARATADAAAQTLTLAAPLTPGRHVVEIAYAGKINRDAYGLFSVDYDAGGASKRMLATQFEPGDARRFAPMFDQPDRKAVFALTVDVPAGQTAIGNMPEAFLARAPGGRTRVTFQPTPKMSSYLLFLAMGELDRITARHGDVEVGVVTRRGEAEKGRYALDSAVKLLAWYDEYFGTPYPLPKLDMLAVPGSGGFGAMENWGAILYFDRYLLLDPALSSETDRQAVFNVVAHEIAHQWFGNLVTMQWWDDLWLNEGFASWMEERVGRALHPEWKPDLVSALARDVAMDLDSRRGTHPIVQTVETLDQANSAFDTITYQKGQAVIRMLEAWIGEDAFRDGVRAYMKRHAYGNTVTADLWRELEAASSLPVARVADSFTRQEGVPLLTIDACRKIDPAAPLTVSQSRFTTDGVARPAQTWTIPLRRQATPGGWAGFDALVDAAGPQVVADLRCSDVDRLDAGRNGYFRLLHAQPEMRTWLKSAFVLLPETDQLGSLQDYWALGRAGRVPMGDYLDLAQALTASPGVEAEPLVLVQVISALGTVSDWQRGRPGEAAWRAQVLAQLRPEFARLGWTARAGEAAGAAQLREQLIGALARLGDEAVVAEARRRVDASERDPSALPGAIRQATLRAAGRGADAATYDRLVARAGRATTFVERQQLLGAVAVARDAALARRTLALALTDAVPRPQKLGLIRAVSAAHPELAWRFVRENRTALEALLDPLQKLQFLPEIASQSADLKVADELDAYAATLPAGNRIDAERASAVIREAAATRGARAPEVDAWLAARTPLP